MEEEVLTGADCVDIRAVIGADAVFRVSIRSTAQDKACMGSTYLVCSGGNV